MRGLPRAAHDVGCCLGLEDAALGQGMGPLPACERSLGLPYRAGVGLVEDPCVPVTRVVRPAHALAEASGESSAVGEGSPHVASRTHILRRVRQKVSSKGLPALSVISGCGSMRQGSRRASLRSWAW